MKIGDLVKCTETGRTGIVAALERYHGAMLAFVSWGSATSWTDAVELEILDSNL